jgi:hypothetical protein
MGAKIYLCTAMVVAKIESALNDYARWLGQVRHHPRVHHWATLSHFQAHWDEQAADFAAMYGQCWFNPEHRRLWHTDHWQPKAMMQRLAEYNPLTVQLMFNDLFNETKDVEARISRFLFGLDALLADYKQDHPGSVENNHYHNDYRMIALYLGCRYPDVYAAPYHFETFVAALQQLGARQLPEVNDIGRFFKMHRTLMTFLDKNESVRANFERHLQSRQHYMGKTVWLAADFTAFVAER